MPAPRLNLGCEPPAGPRRGAAHDAVTGCRANTAAIASRTDADARACSNYSETPPPPVASPARNLLFELDDAEAGSVYGS